MKRVANPIVSVVVAMVVSVAVAVILATTFGAITATPAGASCAGEASLTAAVAYGGPVFVGTVVSTTNRGRWATFAVEEVWSGQVADTQVVKAGPPPPDDQGSFSGSSADRTYEIGKRYIVASGDASGPFTLAPGELQDSLCSATRLWVPTDAAARPPTARIVVRSGPIEIGGEVPDPEVGGNGATTRHRIEQGAGIVAIVALIALCLWLFFRRGSINDRAETDVPLPDSD